MSRIGPWMVVAVALGGILAGFLAGTVATSLGVGPDSRKSAPMEADASPSDVNLLISDQTVKTGLSGEFMANPAEGDPTPEMVWAAVQRVDQLIAEENPARALDILTTLRNRGVADDTLTLRRAVCSEELGSLETALTDYQKLAGRSQNPPMRDMARISQVRVLISLGRHNDAHAIAASFLHESAVAVSAAVSAEATHLIARLLLHTYRGDRPNHAASSDKVIYSNWSPSVYRIIRAVELQNSESSLAADSRAESEPHTLKVISQFGNDARAYHLSVHQQQISVSDLLAQLQSATGMTIRVSPTALRLLDPRKVSIARKSISLVSLLDLIVLPYGAYWKEGIGEVEVETAANIPENDLHVIKSETAIRALENAISTWPTHELAPTSWIGLANMRRESGDVNTALSLYRQLLRSFPKSPVIATALFNKGRIELEQMQIDAALESLYQVVDGHSGHSLTPAAWLHIGRILIRAERETDAVRPLVRALTMSRNLEIQAHAVNALASAYLLNGKDVAASLVLMDYRNAIQDPPHSRISAMLGTFAKFRAASGSRKEAEAVRLVQTLARINTEDIEEDSIRLIAGQAWRAIGMNEEMTTLYKAVVASTEITPLRQRMMYELGDWLRESGTPAEALEVFRKLQLQKENSPWRRRSVEAEVQILFDSGNSRMCAKLTRELLDTSQDSAERRRLLELLGRIYETQGEYSLAAQCFSGIIPSIVQPGNKEPSRE
ncbi:MAG: tetratricopeptide repeat protein [Planctomycetaceae bacterium]